MKNEAVARIFVELGDVFVPNILIGRIEILVDGDIQLECLIFWTQLTALDQIISGLHHMFLYDKLIINYWV